jgi:hypothetical protein
MVKNNLNYAKNELSNAINNIKKFAMINDVPLYSSNINNIIGRIGNQINNVTYYIIPAINKE